MMSASGFYNASPEGRQGIGVHEAIMDFGNLSFYWEKFGIKPHELDDYDPTWLDQMLIVNNAKVDAENANIERTK